jgi:Uma2 family endonuclease
MSTTTFHYEVFEGFSPFVGVGPYRAADFFELPDGEPIELIRGRFVVSPCPLPRHQVISALLTEVFLRAVRKSGGIMFAAPMDVVLSDDTVLQPDLLYITKERRNIVKRRVMDSPDLVVEIISGTTRRDRIEKLDLYSTYGIGEYWIVDPDSRFIEFLINENGRFVVQSPANDRYQSPRLPEVEIELSTFWREVDERLPPE